MVVAALAHPVERADIVGCFAGVDRLRVGQLEEDTALGADTGPFAEEGIDHLGMADTDHLGVADTDQFAMEDRVGRVVHIRIELLRDTDVAEVGRPQSLQEVLENYLPLASGCYHKLAIINHK